MHFPIKRPPVEKVPMTALPDRPTVSVIVPSFQQGRFIRETIDSILDQDYRPLRIHVIDGGSSDETVDVLESYGNLPELDWISEPDRGVVDAVNKGFARMTGDIGAIQSSDDVYLPGTLSEVVGHFLRDADLGLLYGDTVKVDARGKEILRYVIGPWSLQNLLLMRTWIPQPSAFFRRELLESVGGWDPEIPYAPDTDLWLRMAFRTRVQKIDAYWSARRMHDAQRDTQAGKILRDYGRMIDRSPDLAGAPAEIRAAAKAGKHLMWQRYNPTQSDWRVAWHLLCAGIACRQAWKPQKILQNTLLPARRVLSQVKQRFLQARRFAGSERGHKGA